MAKKGTVDIHTNVTKEVNKALAEESKKTGTPKCELIDRALRKTYLRKSVKSNLRKAVK